MPVEWENYRQAMRQFATGVAILTVRDGEKIHAMTANAFTSVSKDPTLTLVCIDKNSETHAIVSRAGNFALSILSADHRAWAERFAKQAPVPPDPFADIAHHRAATGAPILDDCVSYVDCRVINSFDAGDHTVFVGQVAAAGIGPARGKLLLWVGGEYRALDAV